MKKAIGLNEDIFIAVLVIAAVVGYTYAVLAAQIVYTFFLTGYIMSDASGFNMIAMAAITIGVLGTLFGWVSAFALNSMSITMMQGATRKVNRSTRQTLRAALRYTPRITATWAMFAGKIFAPMIGGAVLALISIKLGAQDVNCWLAIPAVFVLTGLFAAGRNLLRYGLAPQVATFEPGLTYKEVFAKSAEMLEAKGKVFVAASYLTFALALSGIVGISYLINQLLDINQAFSSIIGAVILVCIANGVMVMFYRKRRLARN